MTAYRIAALTSALASPTIPLSRTHARELEKRLDAARQEYEYLIAESFPYTYFDRFRITVFGSARADQDNKSDFTFISHLTRRLGEKIDVDIVTGGGGGLMYAANFGLAQAIAEFRTAKKKTQEKNLGILVDLPHGEGANKILDKKEKFHNFSARLEEFIRRSHGIYLAPGGIGTELEATMFMQLKQLGSLEHLFPIVAHPFWKPIIHKSYNAMYKKRLREHKIPLISAHDTQLVHFTDDIPEIVSIFKNEHKAWEKLRTKIIWKK